ncbi:hypothetical protein BDQ17DRAFT_1391908 [Cyathus striatus]|nr:hypothetical protein BDQ17DRAFT_1391908 [Cyathus striatus]
MTRFGYEQHIWLSKDAFCHQFHQMQAQQEAWLDSVERESSMHSDSTPFDGDALSTAADYANDMFGQEELTDIGKEDLDEEDQDDEEAQTATAAMEYDWEPIHPDQQELYEENDEQDDIPAAEIPHEQIEYNIAFRMAAEEHASTQHPLITKFSDVYPTSKPGAILHCTRCFDEAYLNNIGCDSNSWALFTSKLDWEVAKWAKCRGPSSTAFYELLSIDGLQEALNLSYKNTAELNKIIDTKLPSGCPKFQCREVIFDGHSFELYSRDIVECICALWGDSEFTPHLIFEPEQHYVDKDHTIHQYHDMHTAKWWWSIQIEAETKRKDCMIIPVLISSNKTQLTMHGQILLGYLPTTKLDHISNKSSKCRTLSNLFHACMDFIVHPLQAAGWDGIILVSSDGIAWQCYPIFAAYIAIIKTGLCSLCLAPREGIGESPMYLPPQNDSASEVAGIKPVPYLFWKHLPFVNIYCSIVPDILHQLFQGIIKHVISWGICNLSQVTGTEHDQISCFLLGLIIGARFPGHPTLSNHQLVCAVRSILDFVQLAHYPTFHNNKSIFINLGIHQHFNIIKLHYAQHYQFFIELFSTMDNTDTQYTEQLHIDLTKDAYHAMNGKDEFSQMTQWLEHKEWVFDHSKYIMCCQLLGLPVLQAHRPPCILPLVQPRILRMTKYPSCQGVPFSVLRDQYGTLDFEAALAQMVVQHQQLISVFHHVKFISQDPYAADATAQTVVDSLHAQPSHIGKYDVVIPGRFDTALVDFDDKGAIELKGSPPSQHFAYVDWYTPFSATKIDPVSCLYKISRLHVAGKPMSSVIAVDLIKASVHLFPSFGHKAPESWISSMVLDECKMFYVNPFNNRSQYSTII